MTNGITIKWTKIDWEKKRIFNRKRREMEFQMKTKKDI